MGSRENSSRSVAIRCRCYHSTPSWRGNAASAITSATASGAASPKRSSGAPLAGDALAGPDVSLLPRAALMSASSSSSTCGNAPRSSPSEPMLASGEIGSQGALSCEAAIGCKTGGALIGCKTRGALIGCKTGGALSCEAAIGCKTRGALIGCKTAAACGPSSEASPGEESGRGPGSEASPGEAAGLPDSCCLLAGLPNSCCCARLPGCFKDGAASLPKIGGTATSAGAGE